MFVVWSLNRPPVNAKQLAQLREGMSKPDVAALLGAPTSRYADDAEWAYSRAWGWSIVYIYFDPAGRYRSNRIDY